MANRQRSAPHKYIEQSPNETETVPKTLISDEHEPLTCMSSSYELPELSSKYPSASAVKPQQTTSKVHQIQIGNVVSQPSFQCAHSSTASHGQHCTCTANVEFEANWYMPENKLLLTIKDCEVATVGQSTSIKHQSDCEHCSPTGQTQPNNSDDWEARVARFPKNVSGNVVERADVSDVEDNQKQVNLNASQQIEDPQNQNVSDESLVTDIEPSLPLIKKQGYLNGPHCERMMEQLENLQDSGNFEQHMRLVKLYLKHCEKRKITNMEAQRETRQAKQVPGTQCEQLLKKLQLLENNGKLQENEKLLFSLYSRLCEGKENADMEVSLIIEQGVSFMYQKEFKKSKLFLSSVIELGNYCQLRNPNILIARAHFLLVEIYSHMYEEDKKIQALFECLERSEDFLKHHDSPEDWAELYYNRGLVWLADTSTIPVDERRAQARKHVRQNATRAFERAIAFCEKDHRLRVRNKKLSFCHLGSAAVLLDCTWTAARTEIKNKHVTPKDIKDAQRHLDFVERELGDTLSLGPRMHLFKNRSDQYYRQGFYQLAKETAENSLQFATNYGFKTEEETLKKRINFLTDILSKENTPLNTDEDQNSSSDNDASSEASCSDTNVNFVNSLQ